MGGGSLLIVTCSHVGHVFRKATPYTFPGGTGRIINHNNARLAEVWMDEWREFYYKINPGSQSPRQRIHLLLFCGGVIVPRSAPIFVLIGMQPPSLLLRPVSPHPDVFSIDYICGYSPVIFLEKRDCLIWVFCSIFAEPVNMERLKTVLTNFNYHNNQLSMRQALLSSVPCTICSLILFFAGVYSMIDLFYIDMPHLIVSFVLLIPLLPNMLI